MVLVLVFNSLLKYMIFISALLEYQREKILKHPQKQILPHTCTALMAPNIQETIAMSAVVLLTVVGSISD